jgi:hypothetical protein
MLRMRSRGSVGFVEPCLPSLAKQPPAGRNWNSCSPYGSGRSPHWVKVKNPKAPAVKREAEEDWGAELPERRFPPPRASCLVQKRQALVDQTGDHGTDGGEEGPPQISDNGEFAPPGPAALGFITRPTKRRLPLQLAALWRVVALRLADAFQLGALCSLHLWLGHRLCSMRLESIPTTSFHCDFHLIIMTA